MFKSYQLTLTGAVQRLSDVLLTIPPAKSGDAPPAATDLPFRQITLQGLKANTNDIFIGDTNLVSSTVHAFRIDSTDSQPPFVLGNFDTGPIKLSDFWVKGTAAEVLTVGGIPF